LAAACMTRACAAQVLEHSLEAAVLRSDASALAAGCRAEAAVLARRLLKLGGRAFAAERREVRAEMRRLAKEEKRRQGAAANEVWRHSSAGALPPVRARQ
jgi:ATP-dependent RNA/DNA helicase IGHMBP2